MPEAEIRPDRFSADAAELVLGQCLYCRHRATIGVIPACKAFPGGIPAEVLENRADHRRPLDGDDGVRFEARPGLPGAVLARLNAALDALHRSA